MTTAPPQARHDSQRRRATAFGVSYFAGIMLLTLGLLQVLEGIAAVAEDEVFVTGIDYVYKFDVTTWGWIHIGLGAIGVVVAFGILAATEWGQLCGIFLASLNLLVSFAFMPYYPLWSVVLIAFNILVIWALCNQFSSRSQV